MTKADTRIIGWGGLYQDPFDPRWGIEVGYFFDPAAWGHGYATEVIAACTSLADDVLHLPEIHAFAHPENVGSRRVLQKAGFEVVRFVPEMERFFYMRRRRAKPLITSDRPRLDAADVADVVLLQPARPYLDQAQSEGE